MECQALLNSHTWRGGGSMANDPVMCVRTQLGKKSWDLSLPESENANGGGGDGQEVVGQGSEQSSGHQEEGTGCFRLVPKSCG